MLALAAHWEWGKNKEAKQKAVSVIASPHWTIMFSCCCDVCKKDPVQRNVRVGVGWVCRRNSIHVVRPPQGGLCPYDLGSRRGSKARLGRLSLVSPPQPAPQCEVESERHRGSQGMECLPSLLHANRRMESPGHLPCSHENCSWKLEFLSKRYGTRLSTIFGVNTTLHN